MRTNTGATGIRINAASTKAEHMFLAQCACQDTIGALLRMLNHLRAAERRGAARLVAKHLAVFRFVSKTMRRTAFAEMRSEFK